MRLIKKNNKVLFKIILFLLIVCIILGSVGLIFKLTGKEFKKKEEIIPKNINKEFKYEGYLYFYNDNKELINTYKCKTDKCNYAKTSWDEEKFELRTYNNPKITRTNLINNRYAFLEDDKLILYDVINQKIINYYNKVKNYGIGIENNVFIVLNDQNKWGLISLDNELEMILDYNYDYIGLLDKKNDYNQIIASPLVIKKDEGFYIINEKGAELTFKIYNPIIDFNGKYIIVKVNNLYYLINYDGEQLLSYDGYNDLSFTGNYLNVLDQENNLYVYDINNNKILSDKIKINNNEKYNIKINTNNEIEIIVGEKNYKYSIVN